MRRQHEKMCYFHLKKSGRQDAEHWNKLPKATREDTRAETKSSEAQTYILW